MISTETRSVQVVKSETCSPVDSVEALQHLLANQDIEISYDEAQELGNSLVEFFEILAGEVDDEHID